MNLVMDGLIDDLIDGMKTVREKDFPTMQVSSG